MGGRRGSWYPYPQWPDLRPLRWWGTGSRNPGLGPRTTSGWVPGGSGPSRLLTDGDPSEPCPLVGSGRVAHPLPSDSGPGTEVGERPRVREVKRKKTERDKDRARDRERGWVMVVEAGRQGGDEGGGETPGGSGAPCKVEGGGGTSGRDLGRRRSQRSRLSHPNPAPASSSSPALGPSRGGWGDLTPTSPRSLCRPKVPPVYGVWVLRWV